MAYLDLFAVIVAAQPFGGLVLLDEGPFRLERGGVGDVFMLPPSLKRSKVDGRMRCMTGLGVTKMKALKYRSGNHSYFCHFVDVYQCWECRLVDENDEVGVLEGIALGC